MFEARSSGSQPRRFLLGGLALSLHVALTGCQAGASERESHPDGEGILSVQLGSGGGVAVRPPGFFPWRASYGFGLLCLREDADVRLERVRWDATVEPISVTPMLRRVSAQQLDGSPRQTAPFSPFYSALGSPPKWSERYATADLRGDFTKEVAGTEVAAACEQPRDPKAAFTELVFVVEAAEEGARMPRFYVDYTADGSPYTLRVDHAFVLCGTRARSRAC